MPNIVKPSGINQLWAAGGTKVDPGLQKLNIGWVVELPPYQFQNWLDNRQDTFIAHINQHGIPEWDSETEYQGNLSYSQGSDGFIYKCVSTNTNFNPVNPLNSTYWARAFETYGSVAVVQNQLTTHLTNYATLAGITNPVLARNNLSVYSKTESASLFAALSGSPTQTFRVANATIASHAVPLGQLTSLLLSATETQSGQISLATVGETETGTNDTKAITPAKGNAVFLKKSGNLAGIASVAAARTNLGLGDIATQSADAFLRAANNLSELTNTAVARNNLGLGTSAVLPVASLLQSANNLSDVVSVATARNNLGLTSTATTPLASLLQTANNLSDVPNKAVARTNLGLADTATLPSSTFLSRANNLSDLSNVQAARNSLGLGGAAILDVFGVTGNLDFTALLAANGFQKLPSGLLIQWGTAQVPGDGSTLITFPTPFINGGFIGMSGHVGTGFNLTTDAMASFTFVDKTRAYLTNGYGYSGVQMYWFAVGV